jgi:hypothetical protein
MECHGCFSSSVIVALVGGTKKVAFANLTIGSQGDQFSTIVHNLCALKNVHAGKVIVMNFQSIQKTRVVGKQWHIARQPIVIDGQHGHSAIAHFFTEMSRQCTRQAIVIEVQDVEVVHGITTVRPVEWHRPCQLILAQIKIMQMTQIPILWNCPDKLIVV